MGLGSMAIPASLTIITVIIMVWTLVWKGIGLWYSARKKDTIWFLVFLLLNLLGIPEIIYLALKTDFFKTLDKKILKKK